MTRLLWDTIMVATFTLLGMSSGLDWLAAFVVAMVAGTVINFMVWAVK